MIKVNYVYVITATVLLALDFALSKKYQAAEGVSLSAGLRFNALNGLFTALMFFGFSGVEFSLFSALMAFAMSVCMASYSVIGFRILKTGNMSVYSVFLMSGGMLLPYLFGVLFLQEPLTVFRIAGVILILLAVILSNGMKFQRNVSFVWLCVLIFVLNGFCSIISKCHQINTSYASVNSMTFVAYTGLGRFLFSSVLLLCCKKGQKQQPVSLKRTVVLAVGSALIGGVSYGLQLMGAKELPATVLYPLVTGGSIVFSAFSGMIFFREKLSRRQIISIILCVAGTLLFL